MSIEKQIEERLDLSDTIDYAMRDWDDYIDECQEEGIPPIDTFEEYIADYVLRAGYRKQEWISVEERLPDNHRFVLVACEGLTIGGYAQIAIGSYGGGLWSIADADGTGYLTKYMRCVVTHWMPLPSLPEKEKNDD